MHVVPSQTAAQVLIVKLQSVTSPNNYLAIRGGSVLGKVGDCHGYILVVVKYGHHYQCTSQVTIEIVKGTL